MLSLREHELTDISGWNIFSVRLPSSRLLCSTFLSSSMRCCLSYSSLFCLLSFSHTKHRKIISKKIPPDAAITICFHSIGFSANEVEKIVTFPRKTRLPFCLYWGAKGFRWTVSIPAGIKTGVVSLYIRNSHQWTHMGSSTGVHSMKRWAYDNLMSYGGRACINIRIVVFTYI